MIRPHSFHIPVMGVAFTLDSPLKVAQFGIDSVISLVDDLLLEKLRKMFCGEYKIPYQEISSKTNDYRAQRITAYLNLIHDLVEKKVDELKNASNDKMHEIKAYYNMLPDTSHLKQEFKALTEKHFSVGDIKAWLREHLTAGSIDVNIMTKVDAVNYLKGEQLPVEYNDAHAALRGFACSDLNSSLVLSAGMNPSLYGYLEKFDDFFPDEQGELKKKITLKVSDYRSAFIQGRMLAKKGIWVSEYRIESGLNCGGHTFATEGFLLGPILAEFRDNRETLATTVHETLVTALTSKNRHVPASRLPIKVTAQGGVGTAEEHNFLLDHYEVDSVGWGTPFLLVPEATMVDDVTRNLLMEAKEDDLYLSGISPLGVPFNNLRTNTQDARKNELIKQGTPGSACPKKYLTSNTEFTERKICTASRQYQRLKLKELETLQLSEEARKKQFDSITKKACLCVGLTTSAFHTRDIGSPFPGSGVSVCPGPNMAYFSRKMSLKDITDHIYGRGNVIDRTDRPNMFVKEMNYYLDFLKDKIEDTSETMTPKEEKYLINFSTNLKKGIHYYYELFNALKESFSDTKTSLQNDLSDGMKRLQKLISEIERQKRSKELV